MKSAAKLPWVCLLVLGLGLMLMTSTSAQTYTATVTGTVSDQQGAAVPKVRVVATNQGTKLEYTAQTGDSGVYTIPFLPIGAYVLSIEASGFKKLVSNEIKLEVNQTARIDLQLQVGGVNEIVNVLDVAPILQTENVMVGQVISGNTTTALPLNGRNFQQLTLLVPGTINPNPGGFNQAGLQGGQGRPYVNGNREQGNAFLLDGISIDETIDNRISYKPNVDAIAEFKIETSNSSSEFGNVTGATVITTLKAGGNEFRGNVFEFLRNDALDANSWFNNSQPIVTPKSKLRQNVFGGTLGGPIRREKTFFFMDYQGTVQRTGGSGTRNVAPIPWRTGDLSSLGVNIRDPQTCTDPRVLSTCQNFPGGVIPANRIVNPVAKALFADTSLYPTSTNINTQRVAVIPVTTASVLDGHQFDVRIDHRFSDKDNFSGRYSFGNYEARGVRGALPVELTGKSFNRPQNIALNWTRTFSPTVINEARIGFNRAVFITGSLDWADLGNGNSKFGIPGNQVVAGLSLVVLGNNLSNIGGRVVTEDNVTNTFHYGDNLTILRGRHSFKLGGQLQRYQQNRFYPGNNGLLGGFTYDGKYTGVAFADFLLDLMANKSIGSNSGTWGHRQNRIGVFFQDDFKVRNNLTLNLGMRWEYTSPVVEVKDRQSNFDIRTGKQLFAARDGNGRALYDPYYKGFEPRIGFAWTPSKFDGKFVVRAGYGITQYMEGTGSNLRLPLNPPFFSEADQTFDALPVTSAGTITKGFTDVIVRNQPAGNIRVWNPDLRPQFTQQWNLSLEYQLTRETSVTAAYVGHKATHLVAPTDWNQPLPGTGSPNTWLPAQQRRPLFGPLPLVGQISGTDSWAISNYNALQVGVRQRLTKGFEFMLSYTLSKTLTDNLGYYGSGGVAAQGAYSANNYNRHGYNYGLAFFDATHNFVWSGTYDLPVGRGKSFGKDWHPAANAILGGWNVSSIVSAHTGFPITVTATDNFTLQNGRGAQRPNLVGNPKPDNQTLDNWFNIAAFKNPDLGTFGSAGVGIIRAPGYSNWDFGVGKKFYVTEGKYFDFRAEFFNFTNHPSFNPPASNSSVTNTFGRITRTISPPRNLEFVLKFHF
ncbi:MAG: TonB-dependent receptor [Acidobacteria bacterium]|nr:TonB-dependent receptor [Acidobacteriota bacterium]